MDALVRGADWAQAGTSGNVEADVFSAGQTKAPSERGF